MNSSSIYESFAQTLLARTVPASYLNSTPKKRVNNKIQGRPYQFLGSESLPWMSCKIRKALPVQGDSFGNDIRTRLKHPDALAEYPFPVLVDHLCSRKRTNQRGSRTSS